MFDKNQSGDRILEAAKRAFQLSSREAVKQGEKTQESQFLIAPVFAKTMQVRHKEVDFG